MLGKGYSISQISEALMLDFDTIARWESQLRREARLQAISELAFAKQKMCNLKKTFEGFLQ
jgi:transcriptional regulator with XRE-family HTH domain